MSKTSPKAAETVAVEFIGPRDQWIEKRYKSGLTFTKGQVRNLPEDLAKRLLRHPDLFALANLEDSANEQSQDDNGEKDDTAEQLARAKEEADKAKETEFQRQELVDQIMTMDKDALEVFARTQYRQEINKRRSLPNLREEVVGYVDQFGVV